MGLTSVADGIETELQEPAPQSNAECTHSWRTCPVHGLPDGKLPPLQRVLSCLYGGMETKAGTPWDDSDSAEVARRIANRIRP